MTYRPRILSVSAVDCYLRCPANYARRYIQRISDPPTGALAFGSVMAKALEALHRGEDGEVVFIREYQTQIIRAGVKDAPSLEHGLRLLALYRRRGVLLGEPELKFEFHLPDRDAVPVPIVGYLDLATEHTVAEFKTSRGGWDQGRVDGSAQAAVYAWAFQRFRARKPQEVRFLVFSTREERLDEYVTYPAIGESIRLFEQQAAVVWRGVRAGKFPPQCKACPACTAAGFVKPKAEGLTWEMPDA